MLTILIHEMKRNFKNILIWSLSVGIIGMVCIFLYASMEDSMADMASSFSSMGAFSDAFGMSTLSIATLSGYFATEIGTVQGLGGGLFAAGLGIALLSKEEDGHTGEFLFALPISRFKIIYGKFLSLVGGVIVFNVICTICYATGFAILGEWVERDYFLEFMGLQALMNLEIGGVTFCISAFQNRNKIGIGMGIALMLYAYDLMARVIPDLQDYIFIGPYAYSNASEIFSGKEISAVAVAIGVICIVASLMIGTLKYRNKDLQS